VTLQASAGGVAGAQASFSLASSAGDTATLTATRVLAPAQVTAKGQVAPGSGPWYFEEQVLVQSAAPVTAMSLTVQVARSTDASVNGQYDTTGVFDRSSATSATTLSYTFTLKPGMTLPASGATLACQVNLKGTPHPTSGDTWTLVCTSGGVARTMTGGF